MNKDVCWAGDTAASEVLASQAQEAEFSQQNADTCSKSQTEEAEAAQQGALELAD